MTPTSPPRSAAARWVVAIALVLGVLGMHALMGPPAGSHATADTSMSMSASDSHPPVPADEGHAPAGGHSMLTMCLAVLAALATIALLVALSLRWPVTGEVSGLRRAPLATSLGRSPPWTVPSLHQLSLLRV